MPMLEDAEPMPLSADQMTVIAEKNSIRSTLHIAQRLG